MLLPESFIMCVFWKYRNEDSSIENENSSLEKWWLWGDQPTRPLPDFRMHTRTVLTTMWFTGTGLRFYYWLLIAMYWLLMTIYNLYILLVTDGWVPAPGGAIFCLIFIVFSLIFIVFSCIFMYFHCIFIDFHCIFIDFHCIFTFVDWFATDFLFDFYFYWLI